MLRPIQKMAVDVTPDELRAWASYLESGYASATLGDDLPTVTIYGDGCELVLEIDQEAMPKGKARS